MGALHEGHLSLVRRAKADSQRGSGAPVVVSLFVNPKQFAAHEDLGSYPRTWEADMEALARCDTDYVFAPTADEMYPKYLPAQLAPFVDLAGVDDATAEGSSRPGFFRGVSTVVTKLLNIVQPSAVYFGQKDGMQCVVVRRLIEDLNFNTKLIVGETVREADGLAMSSRNVYLSHEERQAAPSVYAALVALQSAYERGETSVETLRQAAASVIADVGPLMSLEYLSLCSGLDGAELPNEATLRHGDCAPILASIAVKLPSTRLIDNVLLGSRE